MHRLRRHWLAVVIIAIGSGAAAAVAAAHHRLFAEVLPYVDADRIVMIPGAMVTYSGGARTIDLSIEEAGEFATLGLYQAGPVTVSTAGGPRRVAAAAVGLDFFGVFRERAIWGRTLGRSDSAGVRRVVLSHELGRHLIQSVPSSPPTVRIDGLSFVVVGVMPEGFDFPNGARVWIPFQTGTQVSQGRGGTSVIGRLADGVSLTDARRRIEGATIAVDWSAPGFDAVRSFRDELSRGVLPVCFAC